MAWFFYDSNGNLLQVTGAHTLASHTGTLAITAGGTGATSATAAASALGVGTEDSPEFTGINVGHASDSTVTRASAGDIAVEGSLIYRAGGTDVPLTDGGTGASSASAAATALGVGTGSSPTFVDTTLTNDLLINSAGIINFASGNMTITHATGSLTVAGGTFATAALTASGVVTGTTVEATADTSAGDNAAIGYTSAEGLILTGQGSTNDITIKNDADAAVISIPTGTTNVTFAGNITVSGTTTTVDSTTLTVVDPIIHLQTATGGGALSGDTNKDVGIAMQYHNGSAAKTAFLGFDDSDSKLMYIPDATLSSEVASGTVGTIKANIEAATLAVTGVTTIRSIAYTWPASDVAGSLRSDGSGALTWTAVSAGVGLGLVIALGG